MRQIKVLLACSGALLLVLFLAGCIPAPAPTPPTSRGALIPTSTVGASEALAGVSPLAPSSTPPLGPAPLAGNSPLAPPQMATVITPTIAAPGTATVMARFLRLDGTPMRFIIIYVAPIVMINNTPGVSVDPMVEPHGTTDANGTLVLGKLKPGASAFVAQNPGGLVLLHDAKGATVKADLQADKVTSLGDTVTGYDWPDG
jgi:hypothetical protein